MDALDSEVPLGLLSALPPGPGPVQRPALPPGPGPRFACAARAGTPVGGDKGTLDSERPRVGAGAWHSVFLSGLGDVYACGWGKHGQLGLGRPSSDGSDSDPSDCDEGGGAGDGGGGGSAGHILPPGVDPHGFPDLLPDGCRKDVPVLVEALGDLTVVSVHAGAKHSVAVTEEGRVYAWGALCVPLSRGLHDLGSGGGSGGEGSSDEVVAACSATPTLCPLPGRCLQLLCGHHHTVAVTLAGSPASQV